MSTGRHLRSVTSDYAPRTQLISLNRRETKVGTATIYGRVENAIGTLQHQMHNSSVAHGNSVELISIRKAVIV